MKRKINALRIMLLVVACTLWCAVGSAQNNIARLDALDIKSFSEGIPGIVTKTNAGGGPLKIGGHYFSSGIGTNGVSVLPFLLDGDAISFTAGVGPDDEANPLSTYKFYVIGDKKILFESKDMKVGDQPEKIQVNLSGIQRLGLLVMVDAANLSRSYSDWVDAAFVMKPGYMPEHIPNTGEKYILTPASSALPKINSAKVFGATAGNPFLFAVAATGVRPMYFTASNLPQGLNIDSATGIISGKVNNKGIYPVVLKAKNKWGETTNILKIKIGDTIALTPPIGWNGWNSWAREIDKDKVLASAHAMVSKGLHNHGWTYINIDDAWQGRREGSDKALQPNEKFPGFKDMADSIHALGLKLGVYSTPWITSYAGYAGGSSNFEDGSYPDSVRDNKRQYRYTGKYRFENADARQMAAWGVDYLKYDWRIDVQSAQRMQEALRKSGRDIVFSISNSAPFDSAATWKKTANVWRTGPDIRDSWTSLYYSAFLLDKWAPYAGPGHWNDADMLIVGNVTTGSKMHPTRLTPDEQYSHVSIFSLLNLPLLIGCPIDQLDAFTLNLLTNDEVIEIDQDPLGKPARLIIEDKGVQVWVKPMEDGSYAVGLFNLAGFGKTPQSFFRWGDEKPVSYQFDFSKAGLLGKWKLRNVWKQQDMGIFSNQFKTVIPHHGVVLLRMYKAG
ncbi:NPCBM/NEW2 domain-containing protein [Parafilimonas terrae]|uniref:Alpha-galactosidase n=1 Tax=Parafilimonas terrae TaxID=1465490 RepID=A0A1I5Y266_9BACT|nr:NPCBM/NEW2 domain-containing protein [Parafilimonas terrae]SFQ38351.1 alpha-galactosidase [Parafilimonas terrae]